MNNQLMQNVKTMSSREIAESTNKDHSHVIRDIRLMLSQIDDPNMDDTDFKEIFDNRGYTSEILLNKDLTLTLVAGYNSKVRYQIVKRWQELEAQTSQPVMPALPQTFAEALQLAADQAKQLELAAPKVAHYDAVADRKTLLNATQVAQSVGLKSAQALNKRLSQVGVYNANCQRGKAFQAWFMQRGLGEMKQGNTGHIQPLFTTKGQIWVYELLSQEVA